MSKANMQTTETSGAVPGSIAAMYAGSASVTIFWVLIILKESYEGISNLLNFYKPVGPLLGLFILALASFAAIYYWAVSSLGSAVPIKQREHQIKASKMFISASILVFFMTFPPIFDVIVDLLKK